MTTLFKTLMRSQYAVDGADGEFLGDLTRPIPYTSFHSEVREGTLAVIPAKRHATLTGRISWYEEAIEDAIHFAMEDRDDYSQETVVEILTDLDHPSQAVLDVRNLRSDLHALRLEFAAL
jgi:hypothetical protein